MARVVLMLIAAAAMTGCGQEQAQGPRGPAKVGVVEVTAERLVLNTELPGRATPHLVAEVRPQVSGLIQKRAFREGADVQAGELLYQIDAALFRAAVNQAEAALQVAEARLPAVRSRAERLKGLAEIGAAGPQDYEDAASALAQAEAELQARQAALESARINLRYTEIRAPISGRIGRSSVTVGATVTAYQPVPLATIQQIDPIYVDVVQASTDLQHLRAGSGGGEPGNGTDTSEVGLLLADGTPYSLNGTLQFRDITVDRSTGTVTLRMLFPNPDYVLLPGVFVRAVVHEGVVEEAILAPQEGVQRDPRGNATALVVGADGRVEARMLVVERAIGSRWLVTQGLTSGDRVIVDGLLAARPGQPVEAVPAGAR